MSCRYKSERKEGYYLVSYASACDQMISRIYLSEWQIWEISRHSVDTTLSNVVMCKHPCTYWLPYVVLYSCIKRAGWLLIKLVWIYLSYCEVILNYIGSSECRFYLQTTIKVIQVKTFYHTQKNLEKKNINKLQLTRQSKTWIKRTKNRNPERTVKQRKKEES